MRADREHVQCSVDPDGGGRDEGAWRLRHPGLCDQLAHVSGARIPVASLLAGGGRHAGDAGMAARTVGLLASYLFLLKVVFY